MKAIILVLAMTSVAAADPKLDQLAGHWEGTGTFTLNGKQMATSIAYDCTSANEAVSCLVVGKLKGMNDYNEHHLFGLNKGTGLYHLFSVNDWGEAYDHAAKWTDADKVVFEYVNGTAKEVYTYTFKGTTLTVHGRFTKDGKVIGEGEHTLTRR